MKKIIVSFVAVVLVSLAVTTTTFAYGGHGRGHDRARHRLGYAPCIVADCDIVNSHQHNNNWYCGQDGLGGHYELCKETNCFAVGLHEHDGEYYHCQNYKTNKVVRRGRGCHRR